MHMLGVFLLSGASQGDPFLWAGQSQVLLQLASNGTNESLTADSTFETSSLSWANWQIQLLMLAIMMLFFAACAAAWWFSFQHPDTFVLSLKDTMTYNALGLLSWIALANASRSVWGNKTLWIMACRFLAVVLAIAVLEMSLFPDPGSMDPLAFAEITEVLTVFVSLLLLVGILAGVSVKE